MVFAFGLGLGTRARNGLEMGLANDVVASLGLTILYYTILVVDNKHPLSA